MAGSSLTITPQVSGNVITGFVANGPVVAFTVSVGGTEIFSEPTLFGQNSAHTGVYLPLDARLGGVITVTWLDATGATGSWDGSSTPELWPEDAFH